MTDQELITALANLAYRLDQTPNTPRNWELGAELADLAAKVDVRLKETTQ